MNPYLSSDDPAAALAALQDAYRGVPIWFGRHTRHFWALVGSGFLEAARPSELARLLDDEAARRMLRADPPDSMSAATALWLPPASSLSVRR